MNATSTQLAVPPTRSLDAVGRCAPASESPPPAVLLLYGEERTNAALAVELVLDGYEVRQASDPARLRAACDSCEMLRSASDGERPLSAQQLRHALNARNRKQQARINMALDRLDAAGLIERRGGHSITAEVAMHFGQLMTPGERTEQGAI